MGPKEFALRTGKPEKTIIAVLKGESALTPDMAVRFEQVTKVPAAYWMNHQRGYDECVARQKYQAEIEQATIWAKSFPLNDLIKMGWLPPASTLQEKTAQILSFFGFSQHTAWEEYYCGQQLKVAFRLSLSQTSNPYAVSAWLRRGELQAAEIEAGAFSEKKFRDCLPRLKTLMAEQPEDFFRQLQHICLEAGVKVVHTPCLQKAPISGATRWLQQTPLIQLSGRFNRNDSFWFSFFHEAGHILLHGKKEIFLENLDYSDKDLSKEREADTFAIKWTLSEEQEAIVTANLPLTDEKLMVYARQFVTHPAIIIGRLQHKKIIAYSFGQEYVTKVVLG